MKSSQEGDDDPVGVAPLETLLHALLNYTYFRSTMERLLELVVVRPNSEQPTEETVYHLLGEHFARCQLPNDIIFVGSIPKTSVGKFNKKVIPERV